MDWWTIAGIAVVAFVVMLSGIAWGRMHDRQARHMQDYGDRERNKYGLWK